MSVEAFVRYNDVATSLTFYVDVLGFEVVQPPDPDPTAFMSMYALVKYNGTPVHLPQRPAQNSSSCQILLGRVFAKT
jgi:catechol 2,3-dioxygenase-like lactoylglutathione lyase family enzyme